MYVWTQEACSPQDLAAALNRLELDGWEVFQILPGTQPIIVANRPAERAEVEAAIQKAPAASRATTMPGLERFSARVPLSPDQPWWQEALQIVQGGKKILAIKRVREWTGLGLKESKDLVENYIMAGARPSTGGSAPTMSATNDEARQLLRQGKRIHAIKLVRERTGMGLREAKAHVESL